MDDFYAACREKVQNTADPVAAINELTTISLRDLPQAQICQFAEQTVTLLSVIFQVANGSPQELTNQFKQIRQYLEGTLNYMEQIMAAEKEFPNLYPNGGGCWW